MDAAAHRHILTRPHVSQSPSAMSHSSNASPIEGTPRAALSQALHHSRSIQGSPVIASGAFARGGGDSPRLLQGAMSALGTAGGAARESPLSTPRSQQPGPLVRTNSTPQVAASKDSPPNSAAALAMEKRRNAVNKADEAHMLRTSSMDSTHSSMSSATTFSQNSSSADGTSSGEIASMIQAAGSAENVIRQLLKEKRSQAAQNNQLFKLLNKQKSMMQGMHVDLEKAMVDRERYKKIAEQLTTLPATPDAQWQFRKPSPAISNISAPSTASGDHLPIQRFPDAEGVTNGIGAAHKDNGVLQNKQASMPRTLSDATVRGEERDTKRDTAIQDKPAALNIHKTGQASQTLGSPQSPKTPKTPDASDSTRTSFTARRSMTQRKDGGQQSVPGSPTEMIAGSPSARKAPPAPLNLGKPPQTAPPPPPIELLGPGDHTESDYTDTDLDMDDLPTFERGRKKTREEDDQEREVIMIRAHRASQSATTEKSRSKSSKKSAKGQISPPVEELPKSPSFKSFSPPESPATFGKGQPASLAGMLSAGSGSSGHLSIQERTVSPPLKSPGLPVSPRPQDRPANAPLPRVANETIAATSITVPGTGLQPGAAAPPLSPRPPRHPIPMPANAPVGPLPQPPMSAPLQPRHGPSHGLPIPQSAALQAPRHTHEHVSHDGMDSSGPQPGTVYLGLKSDSHPDLLLPPNALPSILIKVTSSRLRPSRQSTIGVRNSNDESVFTLGVFARSNNKQLWRVEKAAVSLVQLEHLLKQTQPFEVKVPDRSLFTGHAPARIDARRSALETFFEHVLDTPMNEKAGLILCKYFSTQTIPAEESLHERGQPSLSSIKDRDSPDRVVKEGYLTKKGKNFGGWKARYFVLNEPVLRYYESPGGSLLGAIKLTNAQIGRQSGQKRSPSRGASDTEEDTSFRHAFLIMEPKRNNSSSQLQHVLCAESDAERDEWVEALMFYLGKPLEPSEPKEGKDKDNGKARPPTREGSGRDKSKLLQTMMKEREKRERPSDASDNPPEDALRGFSYSESAAGQAPVMKGPLARNMATPPPTATPAQASPGQRNISGPKGGAPIEDASSWGNKDPMSTTRDMISRPQNAVPITDASIWGNKDVISGPRNAQPITDATAWGNKADRLKVEDNLNPPQSPRGLHVDKAEKEIRKRSFWGGFRGHSTSDSATGLSSSVESDSAMGKRLAAKPVFGIPLQEAVQYCMSPGSPYPLPSPAYRCLEYLEQRGGEMEEGIFRISGSQITINKLKERFNVEGDVDLIHESEHGRGGFDVHAIASLLKMYLRELPERVLTNAMYPAFLKAQELDLEAARIAALNHLVHKLPLPNWTLIFHLIKFLVQVDGASELSKMTVRNIGIVFAPTLNLSNPIIAHFIKDFHAIFETTPPSQDEDDNVGIEVTAPSPRTPGGIPRHNESTPPRIPGPDSDSTTGLGLQYDDVLQLTQGLQLDDTSSLGSDSTRMTNTSSARGTPVSGLGPAPNGEYGGSTMPPGGALGLPGGSNDTRTSRQKKRESNIQMLMGGFPGPGTTMHGPGGAQRKGNMPLMREE